MPAVCLLLALALCALSATAQDAVDKGQKAKWSIDYEDHDRTTEASYYFEGENDPEDFGGAFGEFFFEAQINNNMRGNNTSTRAECEEDSDSTLSPLQVLGNTSSELQYLLKKPPNKHAVCELIELYDQLAKLPSNSSKVSSLQLDASSQVMYYTGLVFDSLANMAGDLDSQDICGESAMTAVIVEQLKVAPYFLDLSTDDSGQVFENEANRLGAVTFVGKHIRAAFVIYPENRSPLHPWPIAGMLRCQVFDVHILAADAQRPFQRLYGMVIFNREALTWTQNLKFGCAQWSEELGDWTEEHCFLHSDIEYPNSASCYCDTQHSGKSTQYIVYEYPEDIHKFTHYEDNYKKIHNSSNVTEMRALEDRLANLTDVSDWKSFEVMIMKVLVGVMQFDSSLLERNSSSELFEKIGDILHGVQPEDDEGMIGRGIGKEAARIHGFVVDLTKFIGDPPIAFVFYRYNEYWFKCFRSQQTIDVNDLFFQEHQYSFMFSSSVLRQNSRYGFVIYPVNKFTKPTAAVEFDVTKSFRVIDLVLVPRSSYNETQLVHMFYSIEYESPLLEVGCAYWSAALQNWTTNGCDANPDLYHGVCTCDITANFNKSQTRGQFVVYKFSHESAQFEEKPAPLIAVEFGQLSLFQLRAVTAYPRDEELVPATVGFLKDLFDFLNLAHFRLTAGEKEQAAQDVRQVLMNNDCDPQPRCLVDSDGPRVCFVGYRVAKTNASNSVVAFSFNLHRRRQGPTAFTANKYNQTLAFNENSSYAVHVSESVTARNSKVVFLIYPANEYLRSLPSTDRVMTWSRVVDIALVPTGAASAGEQLVEIYLDQSETNTTLRCALWQEDLKDWEHEVCTVTEMAALKVCSCKVPPSGGAFLGYTLASVVFDEEVYSKILINAISSPNEVVTQAAALAHNASLLSSVKYFEVRMMDPYLHILMLEASVIAESQAPIEDVLQDIDKFFARYHVNPLEAVCFFSSILGSLKTKSSEIQEDLFSNKVLNANQQDDIQLRSLISIIGIGYFNRRFNKHQYNGFYFNMGNNREEHMRFLEPHLDIEYYIRFRPVLICYVDHKMLEYHRVIFVVYPMAMSPYSKSVSTFSVFNSRQVDLHLDLDNDDARLDAMDASSVIVDPVVELYFQPTGKPKAYVTIGCASWNATSKEWTKDTVCSMVQVALGNNSFDFVCRCNLTGRGITRVMMFEYTERQNFAFADKLEGPQIVFLIGACLSFFGLTAIFLTAVLFPKWREELGNKIMIHLTVSSFSYLTLTSFRETHEIFADTNHSDIGLIVFTVCVHYTRLTHYCWGLAMSVLQYRRFSGVVGATTISHLLLKVSLLAWGLPMAPLAVLLAWNQKIHFCSADKLTHYILYLVPGVIISLFNVGLMVAIILVITACCGCRVNKELQRHGVDETEAMLRKLKQTVLMFFLFGIPAVFEMFNDLGGYFAALEYINKILDPIQGFVLFLFFVVLDNKTSGYWRVKVFGADAVAVAPKVVPKKQIARKAVNKAEPVKGGKVSKGKGPVKSGKVSKGNGPVKSGKVSKETVGSKKTTPEV